ncbi:MAG: hypothetical protein IPH20_11825 [Bacteroidales bacterium]|nr:hypothetical protein [Bacteroidales bacterium]
MKKFLLFILVFTGAVLSLSAQDTIVKTSGEEIYCHILKETASKVFYSERIDGTYQQGQISRVDIRSIKYLRRKSIPVTYANRTFIGIGMGLDFGGIGMNVMYNLTNSLGAYIGAGYALAGVGVNGGVTLRLVSKKPENRVIPYITGMYGYNAAIAVKDADDLNRMFYGPSIGLGIELRARSPKVSCWTFAVIVPFRSSGVQDYIDELKSNYLIEFQNELSPVLFSIGYRFSP